MRKKEAKALKNIGGFNKKAFDAILHGRYLKGSTIFMAHHAFSYLYSQWKPLLPTSLNPTKNK